MPNIVRSGPVVPQVQNVPSNLNPPANPTMNGPGSARKVPNPTPSNIQAPVATPNFGTPSRNSQSGQPVSTSSFYTK
jgi:hypothetical protein